MELDLLNKIQSGRVTRLIELTKENIKKGKEDKYMMDIETIIAMNKDQGRRSKRNSVKPMRFDDEDIENDATPISINRLSVRKNTTGDMLHESDRMAFSGRQSQFEN